MAIFFWSMFGEQIPDRTEATGLAERTYELGEASGRVAVAVVVGVLVFVLGMIMMPITEFLARIGGSLGKALTLWMGWQVHAQRGRRTLRIEVSDAEKLASEADHRNDKHVAKAQSRLKEAKSRLSVIENTHWIRGRWIRRSEKTASIVGTPAKEAGSGLELRMISEARRAGIQATLDKLERVAEVDVVENFYSRALILDVELAQRLSEDVSGDPTDLLHALDEALYQAVDRERSENEVRIAASAPVMAISVLAAVRWTPWALIGGGFAFLAFARSALAGSQLSSRVLRLINVKKLRAPALREAEAAGSDLAAEYVIQIRRQEEEEERHERDRKLLNRATTVADQSGPESPTGRSRP